MIAPLAEHHDQVVALCRRYGVRRLEIFGSVARGAVEPRDYDFLVEFADTPDNMFDRFFGLKADLEALLGKQVDLVSTRVIENPAFLRNIASDRATLYDE